MDRPSLPPIPMADVLGDPDLIRRLVEVNGPYAPVQRYFANQAEMDALAGEDTEAMLAVIAPNFRGDWAYDEPQIEGVEPILGHAGFIRAAADLFGAEIVRPQQVYANLTWKLPFHQGGGHTDIPAFRGFDRTQYPVTFLSLMGHSGLFEAERIKIATGVAWFYKGPDGGFEWWPDGPDAPPRVHEGAIHNTAFMGDNDFMYHRARAVGTPAEGMVEGMTLDSRLVHRGDSRFAIEEGGTTLAEMPFDELRISISWKAVVFTDGAEAARHDDHTHDLTRDEVIDRIAEGLGAEGIAMPTLDEDPTRTPELIKAMRQVWLHEPTVFAA
ncbi:MAG TPA: hypothetical protein VGA13_11980 [Acidimicrobiales bacterium]